MILGPFAKMLKLGKMEEVLVTLRMKERIYSLHVSRTYFAPYKRDAS